MTSWRVAGLVTVSMALVAMITGSTARTSGWWAAGAGWAHAAGWVGVGTCLAVTAAILTGRCALHVCRAAGVILTVVIAGRVWWAVTRPVRWETLVAVTGLWACVWLLAVGVIIGTVADGPARRR